MTGRSVSYRGFKCKSDVSVIWLVSLFVLFKDQKWVAQEFGFQQLQHPLDPHKQNPPPLHHQAVSAYRPTRLPAPQHALALWEAVWFQRQQRPKLHSQHATEIWTGLGNGSKVCRVLKSARARAWSAASEVWEEQSELEAPQDSDWWSINDTTTWTGRNFLPTTPILNVLFCPLMFKLVTHSVYFFAQDFTASSEEMEMQDKTL